MCVRVRVCLCVCLSSVQYQYILLGNFVALIKSKYPLKDEMRVSMKQEHFVNSRVMG